MKKTKPLSAHPPRHLIEGFLDAFNTEPDFFVRAPGRVDLVGTHTDHNDGWVLPAAIDRYVWMAVKSLPAPLMSVRALDLNEDTAFRLTDLDHRKTMSGEPLPRWAEYAAGVAWSLQNAGLATPGIQVALTSDIPIGAGLSSSAAVEVGYALALAHITGWEVEHMELAQLCKQAENEYVGVSSGLMDQFASLFGQDNHALLFDCRNYNWEALPVSEDAALVVTDTGTRRTLVTSAYNERRAECAAAVEALKTMLPGITALRDVTIDQFLAHKDILEEKPRMRAEHVISENNRVLAAGEIMRGGDMRALGTIMDESQISSRDLFEASGPALDTMWEASQGHQARLGGRFIGAGWAGCMVFLVEAEGAEDFIAYTRERYVKIADDQPQFYVLHPSVGASIVSGEITPED